MAKFDLKSYARTGAEARVRELQSELATIYSVFPELRGGGDVVGVKKPRRTSRKPMSAAARKAVGERMRKYWAAKRKSKAAKNTR